MTARLTCRKLILSTGEKRLCWVITWVLQRGVAQDLVEHEPVPGVHQVVRQTIAYTHEVIRVPTTAAATQGRVALHKTAFCDIAVALPTRVLASLLNAL